MKIVTLLLMIMVSVSCGKSSKSSKSRIIPGIEPDEVEEIVAKFSYPSANQLAYEGELLADLSESNPVTTTFGEVLRGRTLNQIKIEGREFIVYGEDGVFTTECEPNADYPEHGPTHPKCQTAHGESFDKIIICASSDSETPIMTAQNWPGYPSAMTDESLGLKCWVNGVKMVSEKIFTY